jgi:hypothetical protein
VFGIADLLLLLGRKKGRQHLVPHLYSLILQIEANTIANNYGSKLVSAKYFQEVYLQKQQTLLW